MLSPRCTAGTEAELRPEEAKVSDEVEEHAILVSSSGAVEFVCSAAAGSLCRLGCVAECEDYHRET